MMNFVRCVAAATALFSASLAFAETPIADAAVASTAAAPVLKTGATLRASDGKRLGRIERVVTSKDGAPVSASIIIDARFAYIPAATITASGSGFVTSLTRAEVRRLK